MKKEFPIKKTLLIFTGGPGTGKSGTVRRFLTYLSDREVGKLSYDEIKEKNWDRFGFDDRDQKQKLDQWSLEEFYLTVQKKMWEGNPLIIEYPFCQKHKNRLEKLAGAAGYCVVTICLYTDYRTEYERSVVRDQKEHRHPGHLLDSYHKECYCEELLENLTPPSFEAFVDAIKEKDYDLALGLHIRIDVTDFSTIHYEELFQTIISYEQTLLQEKKM